MSEEDQSITYLYWTPKLHKSTNMASRSDNRPLMRGTYFYSYGSDNEYRNIVQLIQQFCFTSRSVRYASLIIQTVWHLAKFISDLEI